MWISQSSWLDYWNPNYQKFKTITSVGTLKTRLWSMNEKSSTVSFYYLISRCELTSWMWFLLSLLYEIGQFFFFFLPFLSPKAFYLNKNCLYLTKALILLALDVASRLCIRNVDEEGDNYVLANTAVYLLVLLINILLNLFLVSLWKFLLEMSIRSETTSSWLKPRLTCCSFSSIFYWFCFWFPCKSSFWKCRWGGRQLILG